MELGFHYAVVLPFIGAVLVLASLIYELIGNESNSKKLLKYGLIALIVGWFIYMIPFIRLDYRLAEVANTASDDLNLPLRIAASWAGGGGSLYLYTSLIALSILYIVRSGGDNKRFRIASALVLLVGFISAMLNGAFDVIEGIGGFGINPLLKSYWIIPHPLTTFGGYALLLGASLILLFTEDRARGRAVFLAGWGFLSLGITFGALWSYETLGWGGYWAWDPVEVSELTVWLAATAYLHSVGPISKFKRAMVALTASSTLLAPFVTRSGLSPLHSFASAELGNLLLLLGALGFLGITVKTIMDISQTMNLGISYLKEKIKSASAVDLSVTIAGISIIIMAIFVYASIAVPSFLVALGRDVQIPTMQEGVHFYHPVLYPLFLIALAFLPGFVLGRQIDKRGLAGFLATIIVAAGVIAIGIKSGTIEILPNAPLKTNLEAGIGLAVSTLVGGALIVSLYIIIRRFKRNAEKSGIATTMREFFMKLIHLAMVITFIGVLISGTYSFNDVYFENYQLTLGTPTKIGPYNIILEDYWFVPHNGTIDLAHINGSFVELAAWYGLKVFQLDLANVLQEVNTAEKLVQTNDTLSLIVDKIISNESYTGPELVLHNSTALVQLVNVRGGTETIVSNEPVRITIENPTIILNPEPVYNDQGGLEAGRLTFVLKSQEVSIKAPVDWNKFSLDVHSYYRIHFDEPINLTLRDRIYLSITELELYPSISGTNATNVTVANNTLIMENAYIRIASGEYRVNSTTYPIPYQLPREILLYTLAERGDLPLLKEAINSKLKDLATNETALQEIAGQIHGELGVPRNVPSGITLYLKFKIIGENGESQEVIAKMRFEANGEAIGIHGLVAPVVPIHMGLSDMYVSVVQPYQHGYFGLYHEPLIYYLKVAQQKLSPTESLALTAIMAAGYNIAEISQQPPDQLGVTMEKGIVDLYMLAERFDPANSSINFNGLSIKVKEVPGVNLVWTGAIMLGSLGIIMSILYSVMIHRKIEIKESLV
ncbi:MAG: cytochrome c biogenesis protein CcsA [Desulfurococcales archaeon]|nr:cytochrome c biogenesis protein CcsA [Desulfurococcales archaeon]